MRWLIARELRANPEAKIFANFKIYQGDPWIHEKPTLDEKNQPILDPRVKRIRNIKGIKRKIPSGNVQDILLLDQLGDWLGARNFGSEYNQKMAKVVVEARKYKYILSYSDQYHIGTDIKVRNNVSVIYQPMGIARRQDPVGYWIFEQPPSAEGIRPFGVFELYSMGPGLTTAKQWTDLPAGRIQEFFDSYEQISSQTQENFRPKSHVKSVLTWAARHRINWGEMSYGSRRVDDYLIRFEEERGKTLTNRQRSRVRTEMDLMHLFKVRGE
jgi:hypothetical protein